MAHFLWGGGDGFRGYVFPLFLGICNRLGGICGWQIMNAVMVSTLFTRIIPCFLENEDSQRTKTRLDYRAIFCYIIFTILFLGLELSPLSDLPAIFLCASAICVVKYIIDVKGITKLLWSVFWGILLYSSYNVRTIYLFAVIYLLFFLLSQLWRKRTKIYDTIKIIGGALIGFFIAAMPQIYMNYVAYGEFSVKVPTNGLMAYQFFWGMETQMFAANVGADYVYGGMRFYDSVGRHILQKEGIEEAISIGTYIKIFLKYPFELAGMYIRHLVNGILCLWPEIYAENINNSKVIISLISFSCFFCLILACLFSCIKQSKIFWSFSTIIIPVVCIIPGAMESRFMAAFFLFILYTLCYNVDWLKLITTIKKYKIRIVFCYLSVYVCFVAIWTSMLASLQPDYPIFFG